MVSTPTQPVSESPDSQRTTDELLKTLGDDVYRCLNLLEEARQLLKLSTERDIRNELPPEIATELAATQNADISMTVANWFEYHARQLFRTVFACIEGVTFTVKTRTASFCAIEGVDLTDGEQDFAQERDFKLRDNGTVVEQFAHLRLLDNVRFTIRIIEKAHRMPPTFSANVAWWSALTNSIKVRDRLMHPKLPEDLDIKSAEIDTLVTAFEGLVDHYKSYPGLVPSKPPYSPAR
jgi:hypothetical protein